MEEVVDGVVARGEAGGELAGGADEQRGDDEPTETVADDLELLADVEVLPEDALHPHPPFLHLDEQGAGEVLEAEALEVADEAEEDAGEEVDGAAVHPGGHLEGAGEDVAEETSASTSVLS